MKRAFKLSIVVLLLAFCAMATTAVGEPTGMAYRVIVNSKNPVSSVERAFLRDAFLKKSRYWSDRSAIRPVDLHAHSAVRKDFSTDVVGRSVAAVKAYWRQRVFAGQDVPPPEVANDVEVIGYVQRNEGALGYVSAAAAVDGVKVVSVR
jgi:ABC-type phosphate transport system substrate-binding protein